MQAVQPLLGSSLIDVQMSVTNAPGHATLLARASAGFTGIVAIGGDGTIAEVLAGMDIAHQRLAVIPAGHGNSLARDLGLIHTRQAVAALQQGHACTIDLMQAGIEFSTGPAKSLLAASTLAAGYVCHVVLAAGRMLRLGRGAYAAASAFTVPRPLDAHVAIGGQPERLPHLTGVIVNNTVHLANFRAFPQASLTDGQVDIMESAFGWPRQTLHNLAVLAHSPAFGPVRVRQSPCISVEFDFPVPLMADGEILQNVIRFHAACLPAALTCIRAA